ncbi:MAG: hypothetical protein NC254_12365 [bacterium]|nr:hypothetical protein [bacterium]
MRETKEGNPKAKRFWTKGLRRVLALLCCICMLPIGSMLSIGNLDAQAKDAGTAFSIGIDVSRYQGDIDWSAVAACGVQYAFVRVGSVRYGIDTKFDQNMRQAAANGVKTGVYIYSYATTPQEAAAEAVFVLQAIAGYTISMPVAIDIEDSVQRTLSPAQIAEIANTFCAIIENAGYYPIVYGSKNWYLNYIGPIAYDKWVAQYNTTCDIEDAAFWQASSTGRIPGIAGNVDIDYQYKDLSASIVGNGFAFRKGFYYFYENYKMKTNTFVQYNGGIYYVDALGRRVSGFAQLADSIYFFDGNGLMQFGWQELAGNTYYFGTEGKMAVGMQQIGDAVYLFDPTGCMYRGWLAADNLFYFYEDGHMAIGLSAIASDLYYFNENGCLQVGWQNIGGQLYYFDPADAKMAFGFVNDGTGIYYTNENGQMQTGLIAVGGDVYYMGTDGRMQIGMQNIGGETYFFNAEGKRQTGFVGDGITTYYFNPETGAMAKGWTIIGSSMYCFDPATGQMLTGLQQIGELLYLFDAEGRLILNQQLVIGSALYISDANGCVTVIPIE